MAASDLRVCETPRQVCLCGGTLYHSHDIDAELLSFDGLVPVKHRVWRCSSAACRTHHYHNYRMVQGQKINTVSLDKVNCLFVTSKMAFDLKYLRFNESLHFRGYVSAKAVTWSTQDVLLEDFGRTHLHELYEDARFLMLAMQELPFYGTRYLHQIVVGDEISDDALMLYDDYMHNIKFVPADPSSVLAIAGDGNEKVLQKLCPGEAPPGRRTGRPRRGSSGSKAMTNGWFVLSDPHDGCILAVERQLLPENNEVKKRVLARVLPLYPNADCFVHDRNCSLEQSALQQPEFKQIKYWPIDMWHGAKHKAGCPNNPHKVLRLKRRVSGMNTSVAEQVFAWLRGYVKTFNNMRPQRHHFILLYYASRHNELMRAGRTDHLPPISAKKLKKRPAGSYPCTKKPARAWPFACTKKPACKCRRSSA